MIAITPSNQWPLDLDLPLLLVLAVFLASTSFKRKISCLCGHSHKAICLPVTLLKGLCSQISLISEFFSPGRAIIEDEKEENPSLEGGKQEEKKIFKVSYP